MQLKQYTLKIDLRKNTKNAGIIINNFNFLENSIAALITRYFRPRNDGKLFEEIVLNSSVLHMGVKIKILANLDDFDNKVLDKIRKVSRIRNGVAHSIIFTNISYPDMEYSNKLKIMGGGGKIKEEDFDDIFKEFNQLMKEINLYIKDYRENLK